MSTQHVHLARLRTRWSAVGAAVAITLGAGGVGLTHAGVDTGDRPVSVSITAERILDTRSNLGLSGRFADATPRDLQVTGSVDVASGTAKKTVVPADAIGVQVNVTVVTPTHDGFLSLRPSGATGEPTTSTVNFTPGSIEPNAATVDLKDGKIQIWVETASDAGSADVLIDIVGYTIGHTHDDRYYTKAEIDDLLGAKSDAPTGTSSIRFGAALFRPASSPQMSFYRTFNGWVTQAGNSTCMLAPLALPDGVTVTGFSAKLSNDGTAGTEVRLMNGTVFDITEMAMMTDTTASGVDVISTTSITDPIVNTGDNDYFAEVCLINPSWMYDVTVTFTYPD